MGAIKFYWVLLNVVNFSTFKGFDQILPSFVTV